VLLVAPEIVQIDTLSLLLAQSRHRRYAALAPLLDAEYGSGTYIPVKRRAEFKVRISTTALLIREVPLR
jgi:hypothetical protein